MTVKILTTCIAVVLFTACNHFEKRSQQEIEDSVQRARLMDTVNMKTCPIEITFSGLSGAGENKSVKLNYHNKSGRRIIRVVFLWYGLNAKDIPADNGPGNSGVSGGIDNEGLDSAMYKSGSWPMGGHSMTKLVAVWPSEVLYEGGTSWHAGRF